MKRIISPLVKTAEKRGEISSLLWQLINQGDTAKGSLPAVWAEIGRIHRNEAPVEDDPTGPVQALHIPLSSPRQDMLAASVCNVLLSQNPYMMCQECVSAEATFRKESLLHWAWKNGGFEQACRRAASVATDTNKAIWRVVFDFQAGGMLPDGANQIQSQLPSQNGVRYAGIKVDVTHPNDYTIAPVSIDGIQSAAMVCNRIWTRKSRILELQALGEYFDGTEDGAGGDMSATGDPSEYDLGDISFSGTVPYVFSTDETKLIEIRDGYVRMAPKDGVPERWFHFVYAFKEKYILVFDEWDMSRPPNFTSGFITDATDFYSGRSVGRALQPLQDIYDKLWSVFYEGAKSSARPPIIGPQLDGMEKDTEWSAGDYLVSSGGAQPYSPAIAFNGSAVLAQIAATERQADATARVSTNALGARDPAATTATQTNAIQSGVATGIEDYIATFTEDFPAMAAFTMELLLANYPLWAPYYPGELITPEELALPCTWVPAGRTPADSPGARLAFIQTMVQMAAHPVLGPMSMLDVYAMTTGALVNSGIPGADKWQLPRPVPPGPIPMQEDPNAMGAVSPIPQGTPEALPGGTMSPMPSDGGFGNVSLAG